MKTVTTLISFILIVNFSIAQPGTLDSSFGLNGTAVVEGLNMPMLLPTVRWESDCSR